MSKQDQPNTDTLKAVTWPLRLTRFGMVAERATQAFWPLWAVCMLALALVMLGVQDFIAPRRAMIVAVLFGIAAIYALIYGLRLFRWPNKPEAINRLDSTLKGHPITALNDTQAIGATDEASQAVWQAHLQQMSTRLKAAKPVPADLRVSSKDPYALRYVAALALLVALLFGSVTKVATVGDIATGQGGTTVATGPSWEGWIEPPAYTGKPSLYLNDLPTGDLNLPVGSKITVRLYGEIGALEVHETVSTQTETGNEIDTASATQEVSVDQDGVLRIGDDGDEWVIAVLPDLRPKIWVDGTLTREAQGVMRQPFAASDDYDLVRGTAEFKLDLGAIERRYGLVVDPTPREPIILDLPLPITGDRSAFAEELVDNLSEHPWVGLPVTMTLSVEDALGQLGHSEPLKMPLAGRRFFAPLARAVIEQRRDLLWSRENGTRVAQVLRAATHRPEGFVRNNGAYLMLRVALTRLEAAVAFGMDQATQDEIAAALWEIALVFEDGSLSDAKERLHRAQERLAEAMKNGASKDEIAELMQELRDATKDYMRQLAEQQRQNGDQQQQAQSGESMSISQAEIQALVDRIQELMEEGRMEEAAELMQKMNEMMEDLQMAQGGEGGEPSAGEQSMEDLKDTLRDQQGLSDQAFRDLQEQFNPNANRGESSQNRGEAGGQGQGRSHEGEGGGEGQGESGGQDGEQGGGQTGAGQESLADRQQALRDALQDQKGNLPNAGTPEGDAAREALGRAEDAMDRAEEALRGENLAEALDNQAEAMEAMREGMRSLGEAMAKNQQQQNPSQQGQALGRGENGRDPLGRDNAGNGKLGGNDPLVEGDDVYRRARDLLDEIRRRSGDQNRPDLELEYLERLLDRF